MRIETVSSDDPLRDPAVDGILAYYEEILSGSIGCLSRFIVLKQYDNLTDHGRLPLDSRRKKELAERIASEVSVLVGPTMTDRLKASLLGLAEEAPISEELY